MNPFRAYFRLLRVLLHISQGCFTVACIYPWLKESSRLALKRRWSRQLLAMMGVHIRLQSTSGQPLTLPQGLIVANHISFLDIFVINAIAPAAFVSKDDVRAWPVIGWLCTHTDTLFLERGSRNAAQRARENLVDHLQRGKRVALFPEGTTSLGDSVLPFHSALLQSAIDAETTVTPLALRYRCPRNTPSTAPAYVGDTSLLACLFNIAREQKLHAEVIVLESLSAGAACRRQLSAQAHRAIATTLHANSTGLSSA